MTVAPLTSRSAGLPAAERGRRAAMLTVLLAGQFMGLLDVFVVNVALPTIGASLPRLGGVAATGRRRLHHRLRHAADHRRPETSTDGGGCT
jgi:hypothetical protein